MWHAFKWDFHENSGSEETLKAHNSYFFYLLEFLSLPVVNMIQCSQCPESRAPGQVKTLFAEYHEMLI